MSIIVTKSISWTRPNSIKIITTNGQKPMMMISPITMATLIPNVWRGCLPKPPLIMTNPLLILVAAQA